MKPKSTKKRNKLKKNKTIKNKKSNIKKALKYAKKFDGMKYSVTETPPTRDGPPFWISNSPPPPIDYIKKYGSCCAGLINLMRRYVGLEVPGHVTGQKKHIFIGGTGAWFSYLNSKKRLHKIDFSKTYPDGTLLLQDYNPVDMGHVAVVLKLSKKGVLHSKIIHNVRGSFKKKKYREVVIEILEDYPDNKRFTHICLPKDWLVKN